MRLVTIGFVVLFILSCGSSKSEIVENPTNCAVKEVEGGVEFRCIDKDGVESSGIVKHGETGAQGEVGPQGKPGLNGQGLGLASQTKCSGSIEGWMEGSSYAVELVMSGFETGDKFLSATTKLLRGDEVLNVRSASAFYMAGSDSLELHDGQFSMVLSGDSLEVSSKGGVKATLPCEDVK